MTVIEYKKYFERLKGEGDFSRLGKVFKTKEKYYFFDTGTGKILECTEIEYNILKQLGEENTLDVKKLEYSLKDIQATINDIISMVEKENILIIKIENVINNFLYIKLSSLFIDLQY